MFRVTGATPEQTGIIPVVTLSLENPDTFLRSYLSDLNLTFDSPTERVLDIAERRDYPRAPRELIPEKQSEQLRFLSPRYEYFAPVSNASRLANPEAIALVIDRAVDRARGIA